MVKVLLITTSLLNLGCSNMTREFDGVWEVTHFKLNHEFVLENDLDVSPKDVPSYKRILFFINSSRGQAGFNYTRDQTTNSEFEFLNDSTLLINSNKDKYFYGQYHIKYENNYYSENNDTWITREETLELTSDKSIIKMIRGELIDKSGRDILGRK